MKAWQFIGPNQPLILIDRAAPVPAADEVLLDVYAAGLCHSDVGIMEGILDQVLGKCPIILGHEIGGVVAAIGDDVQSFAVGDRVAVRAGPDTPGVATDGAYAEQVVARADMVCKVPTNVPFVQAAAATDAGMTAHNALINVGQLQRGQRVAIIGIGGLGSVALQIALGVGATVYAVDPKPEAQALARSFAIESCVADISELAGQELDLVVDYAGFGTTTAGAIDAVKFRGTIVLVGLGAAHTTFETQKLVAKAVRLLGASAGSLDDVIRVLEMIAKGQVEIPASAISFDEIPEGLDRLHAGTVTGRLVAILKSE